MRIPKKSGTPIGRKWEFQKYRPEDRPSGLEGQLGGGDWIGGDLKVISFLIHKEYSQR
jgi:hypothetical protein